MPVLYLAGSLAGIALLVGFNLLLFGRVRPDVGSADAIAGRLAREIPGFRPGRAIVGADGRAAVIENAQTRALFLIEAMGDGIVTRQLTGGLLANVGRLGARLSLELRDFTFPRAVLVAPSESVAREWEMRLKP
jgi:Ser/Thr protein kinase RdoA (MazF antagonist)